jgi:mono/diheme cytochrome c family protein
MSQRFPFRNDPASRAVRCGFLAAVFFAALATVAPVTPSAAAKNKGAEPAASAMIVVPNVESQRGRRLFVVKGCVLCHSVKGVGGKAAPALDAMVAGAPVDLLDFAARMWRGAAAMQALQSLELGYLIELSGKDIGDLAAFSLDTAAQVGFSLDEVPTLMSDWFIDEPYWESGDWPESEEWRFPK